MRMEISWLEDCHFNIVTENGFELSADAENKTAPCPTEILLSALGSCSLTGTMLEGSKKSVAVCFTEIENSTQPIIDKGWPPDFMAGHFTFYSSLSKDTINLFQGIISHVLWPP